MDASDFCFVIQPLLNVQNRDRALCFPTNGSATPQVTRIESRFSRCLTSSDHRPPTKLLRFKTWRSSPREVHFSRQTTFFGNGRIDLHQARHPLPLVSGAECSAAPTQQFEPAFREDQVEEIKGDRLAGSTVAVTGCSRGIGLEFCVQLLGRNCKVIGLCRNPSAPGVKKLLEEYPSDFIAIPLDISDESSIQTAAGEIQQRVGTVDILINSAGIYSPSDLAEVTEKDMTDCFMTNTVGPLLLARALVPLINRSRRKPKIIANVTSKVASVADNRSGGRYAYRASKMALNIVNKSLSIDLASAGITCILLHPGYVRTDMTRGQGLIDPPESVSGLLKVLEHAEGRTGQWFDFKGEEIPW